MGKDNETKKKKKKDKKLDPAAQKRRRRIRLALLAVAVVFMLACLITVHSVRGTLIEAPDASTYNQAVRRAAYGSLRVGSQEDMDDLGAIAHRTVGDAGLAPGVFYVHFLPSLDVREKLHHLLHSPFTGLGSIYTDVWINSCTTYGVKESSWGLRATHVYPADKLSILIILIDRLKREKTRIGEHLGAYFEVMAGMKLHTVPGRASCYQLLVRRCAQDTELTRFVRKQLLRRNINALDPSESELWRCLAANPTYATLEELAAGETCSEVPATEERIDCAQAFGAIRMTCLEAMEAEARENGAAPGTPGEPDGGAP